VYAFFDGDNIGDTIEIMLIEDRIDEAIILSDSITSFNDEIEKFLEKKSDVLIILSGGDDLLIQYDFDKYGTQILEEIRMIFVNKTGLSISCGFGDEIAHAINNLRLAKLYGKNQIKGTP
jgi:hypothetical protein